MRSAMEEKAVAAETMACAVENAKAELEAGRQAAAAAVEEARAEACSLSVASVSEAVERPPKSAILKSFAPASFAVLSCSLGVLWRCWRNLAVLYRV